jgi:hypothetical protein
MENPMLLSQSAQRAIALGRSGRVEAADVGSFRVIDK